MAFARGSGVYRRQRCLLQTGAIVRGQRYLFMAGTVAFAWGKDTRSAVSGLQTNR